MILKETLRKVVRLQKEELKEKELGVIREGLEEIDIKLPYAIILSGIRRCGKSTLLRQLMNSIKNYNYFNFEDSRAVKFEISDSEKLMDVFEEENGKCDYYFFDEIQNVSQWEKMVRNLLDFGKKCIITGSNASLLSKELGTRLTGRHLTYELFPFTYNEMLKLKKLNPSLKSFEKYFIMGGFPDFLKFEKTEMLQELFDDILNRDIIIRHKLKEAKIIKDLGVFLLSNVGKEFSYNRIAQLFNIGSTNTVSSYIWYFEESYLFFTVPKFDYSYKKQLVNPKKIYSIDVGLAKANSASFSEDRGRILENLVFLRLRRDYKGIFYFKGKKECDFIVKDKGKAKEAIQVCYELNEDNQERELGGLKEAMQELKLKKGNIITFNQEDKLDGINIIPFWKWVAK
ncbi:MAG: ATP-binding protein [Nanoarchaeota archaeon]|nr:ATP-binding protein [Nanoarchaeota archaeon]